MTREVSLIVDAPARGSWNMSVDETLLKRAADDGVATLRFYQWSAPTLSLGYFQQYADRTTHPPSLTCDVVRRASGGGAIMHDHELTYSYCIPVESRKTFKSEALYDAFHGSLVELLRERGVDCGLVGDATTSAKPEPFLCFQRRSSADIVVDGEKMVGSAQRKQRGALLQHGSIILRRSAFAPEIVGLEAWLRISAEELVDAWTPKLATSLALQFHNSTLPIQVEDVATHIEQTKFGLPNWTQRK